MNNSGKPFFYTYRRAGIAIILLVYVVLAVVYSVATPIFEASDEIWHYPYVKLIADGKGLPVQRPDSPDNYARQEGSQPPLYYAVSALATFWINTGDFSSLVWVNPHAKVGDPLAIGNKNMAVHTPQEDFPYHGPALAVMIIRWMSILMGAVTVICVYATARNLLPSRTEIALGSAALIAFDPQFVFISASVNNDNLIIMMSSLTVLSLIVFVRKGMTQPQSILLGLMLGLAFLTKLTGLGLIPIALLCIALISYRQRSLSHFVYRAATVSFLAILIAGWWYLRNWQLYDDPTGLNAMLKVVGVRNATPMELLAEFEGFRISFWALFGAVNVIADPWIYKLLDGITILSVFGLTITAVRYLLSFRTLPSVASYQTHLVMGQHAVRESKSWLSSMFDRRQPISSGVLFLIPTSWLLIVFVLFLKWTQTTMGSQGRLIFPAFTGFALLFSLGLTSIVPKKLTWLPLTILGTFLLGVTIVAPFRYMVPSYAAPRLLSEKEIPSSIEKVNIDYGGRMRLIGYSLDRQTLRPGDSITLTLYWQSLSKMDKDYSIFIHFDGRDNRTVAHEDTYPGLGTYPTRRWSVGDIIREEYHLSVEPNPTAPALVHLVIGMYTLSDMNRLDAYNQQGTTLGDGPVLADLKLASVGAPPAPNHTLNNTSFADTISLVGYDLPNTVVKPGDSLRLTLYWKANKSVPQDYTVFTQLLSTGQVIYGQHDSPPVGGQYPTHLWDKGELVLDERTIQVQQNTPPGEYQIVAGMYLPSTNERLRLGGLEARQDYVNIAKITVEGN